MTSKNISGLPYLLAIVSLWIAASNAIDAAPPTAAMQAIMDAPPYRHAQWGLLVVDTATGETLFEHNPDKLFVPASTTKLFSVAAALAELGSDFRFRTPVVATADKDAEGRVAGDLVLIASGDLSLGGRTDVAGRIAFANSDHTYADFSTISEMTPQDPLAGIKELARKIAASGIRAIQGDVLVDDRMFEHAQSTGSGPRKLTPVLLNDNVIDVRIAPGAAVGQPATVSWRPVTSAWKFDAVVTTGAVGSGSKLVLTRPDERTLVLRGTIAAESGPVIKTAEVEDPASFARTALIDALVAEGVAVNASPLDSNHRDRLPASDWLKSRPPVAVLESPPFSESARLILKVSHNLQASTLPLLLAARNGKRTLADGLHRQKQILNTLGVETDTISFGGGAGGDRADYITPRAAVSLLRHMATRPDAKAYRDAMPVLGVDGTLAAAASAENRARGHVWAKTGTLLWDNVMNERSLLTSKALAGYMENARGRDLAFALFVNNVHLGNGLQTSDVGRELARVCEAIYDEAP